MSLLTKERVSRFLSISLVISPYLGLVNMEGDYEMIGVGQKKYFFHSDTQQKFQIFECIRNASLLLIF